MTCTTLLCKALIALYSGAVEPGRLEEASTAILAVSDEFDPALVAAIPAGDKYGAGESWFNPLAVGPKYGACGPMQVLWSTTNRARQDRLCRQLLARGVVAGYEAGVQRLRDAKEFCDRRHNYAVGCWIAGFQGGPSIVRAWEAGNKRVRRRAQRVLDRAEAIRRAAQTAVIEEM